MGFDNSIFNLFPFRKE